MLTLLSKKDPQKSKRTILRTMTLSLLVLLLAALPKRATAGASEYAVKAAYLFNFTQFVQWPKGALADGAPLVIGIAGDDPFGSDLDDAVKGKSAGGHPLEVKRFGSGKVGKCQVLFIAFSEKSRVKEILQSAGKGVLTVSEIEQFPLKGGIIQFDQEGQKIVLTLNAAAAKKGGLTISSQLLQVAKLYGGE
jgi:hypothetical protein